MAQRTDLELRVFYLWDFGVTPRRDPAFGQAVQWDVPLLDGYSYEFVRNLSRRPGTDRFFGLRNPLILRRLQDFQPDATLLIGYRYAAMMRLIFVSKRRRGFPLLFRGDSHRLTPEARGQRTEDGRSKPDGKGQRAEVGDERSVVSSPLSLLRKWVISRIFSRFDAFLYVGQANREYFRMHGVPQRKLFFAPHAVDNARFQLTNGVKEQAQIWKRELGISPEKLVVMFAGKFEPKKRPFDLLEAFSQLKCNNAVLLLVGSGALETELRSRASSVDNVCFAPFQNQSQMPRSYAGCDLFVLPSYGGEESWGLAVNEAMGVSCAVIVSDHVGCAADLVRPHENGLIFPAGDIRALADALREALSDRVRLREWGRNSRAIVSRYSYEGATQGLQTAIAAVVRKEHESDRHYCRP
jgi:glycosyltransferase involved in cell wall biosynthesis